MVYGKIWRVINKSIITMKIITTPVTTVIFRLNNIGLGEEMLSKNARMIYLLELYKINEREQNTSYLKIFYNYLRCARINIL